MTTTSSTQVSNDVKAILARAELGYPVALRWIKWGVFHLTPFLTSKIIGRARLRLKALNEYAVVEW